MITPRARECIIGNRILRDDSNYNFVQNKNDWRTPKCDPTQEDESCEDSFLVSSIKDNFSKRITSDYLALLNLGITTPLDRRKHVRHESVIKSLAIGYDSAGDIHQHVQIVFGKTSSNNEITKFIPSDRLVSYYIKAVKELSDLSKNIGKQNPSDYVQTNEPDKITKDDAAIYVQKIVTRLISTIGKGAFEANLDYFPLTNKLGRFSPNVCKVILDRILIDEYDIPDFLNQLYIDLVPIAESKGFRRKWGKLIMQNDKLIIELNKHKEESDSNWNRAKMF